jgi:trehalose-phosphatase
MTSHKLLIGIPAALWRMVVLARRRLLMLDYDGTLAPLTLERSEALPEPRSLDLLKRIAESDHTSIAIVSGRPLREIEAQLGTLRATFVGEHGWEWRGPNGELVRKPLDETLLHALEAAERIAASNGWSELIERKRSAIVLHTRALAKPEALEIEERCLSAWGRLAGEARMTLDRIDGGIELRAGDPNKGTVVLSLMSQVGLGALGVFVGDDVTDEDAFDAVKDWGFGVRVGDTEAPSIAQGRLPSSDAVPEFLEEWLRLTGHSRAPEETG